MISSEMLQSMAIWSMLKILGLMSRTHLQVTGQPQAKAHAKVPDEPNKSDPHFQVYSDIHEES